MYTQQQNKKKKKEKKEKMKTVSLLSHGFKLFQKNIVLQIRGMFEMNCLLSSSSISTWGTIKTNTYLYRAIQYLHNGI